MWDGNFVPLLAPGPPRKGGVAPAGFEKKAKTLTPTKKALRRSLTRARSGSASPTKIPETFRRGAATYQNQEILTWVERWAFVGDLVEVGGRFYVSLKTTNFYI